MGNRVICKQEEFASSGDDTGVVARVESLRGRNSAFKPRRLRLAGQRVV